MYSIFYLAFLFQFLGSLGAALSPKAPYPITPRAPSPGTGSFDRLACQTPSSDPLSGCPTDTILVGTNATFKTIQSAIASLPNTTDPAYILILPGNYTEQVNVTRSGPVYLLGQTSNIQDQGSNLVNVIWAAVAGTGDNAYTATLTVAPNLNADLTGSGPTGFPVPSDTPFGNTDFRAYNLNFINDFVPYSDGPSLALSMGYANAGFYYSGFFSYQDTVRRIDCKKRHILIAADIRRKDRKRVFLTMCHCRPDRFLLWIRYRVDPVQRHPIKRLWRRHNCLERHKHNLREQIWSVYYREQCAQGK